MDTLYIIYKNSLRLLLTHSLLDSVSWSSTLSFSSCPRHSLRSQTSSLFSVIVPTETPASVAMVNPRISVSAAWTSWSNWPLRLADWACLLLSSSLWLEERGVGLWWICHRWLHVFTWTTSYSFLSPSPPPTAFSTVSVYSTLCNLGHTNTHTHLFH